MTDLALPTEKTRHDLHPQRMNVLLYGPPKVGKTSIAADFDPDHTLILAADPSMSGVEAFTRPVDSWEQFREYGALLSKDRKQFNHVVIDTVDDLGRMCTEAVIAGIGNKNVRHPSDLDYGKGWNMVSEEWRLRLGRLMSAVPSVWFIAHSKEVTEKDRLNREFTKFIPDLPGQMAKYLAQVCEGIFFVTTETTEDGERRVIHTAKTQGYEAGARVAVDGTSYPDPIEFTAEAPAQGLREAMYAACGVTPTTEKE